MIWDRVFVWPMPAAAGGSGDRRQRSTGVHGVTRTSGVMAKRQRSKLSRLVSFAIAAYILACVPASSGDLPDLPDTVLYTKLARDCHPVDLTAWDHPTKQVLGQFHVRLFALELCNANRYPIFHVYFEANPMGLADSFFVPFYDAMFKANGRNPMAFVETMSGDVIVMIGNDHGRLKIAYELYRA